MPKPPPEQVAIYHITDVANLPGILAAGGLRSDAAMIGINPTVIGYKHIKQRRLTELRVACCGDRFVGEFVPFYFCPRSPMLYTLNRGNVGPPAGCQRTIVHLVSTAAVGMSLGRPWAISDGNAGARYALFSNDPKALAGLNWAAIRATSWQGQTHSKSAEFLVADFFPWTAVQRIGFHPSLDRKVVDDLLAGMAHRPVAEPEPNWYY